jgi:hypothetical protein
MDMKRHMLICFVFSYIHVGLVDMEKEWNNYKMKVLFVKKDGR